MNICPITYEEIEAKERYSKKGLRLLGGVNLRHLSDFPYTAEQQRAEAEILASKISIQGVQPKLSVKLNTRKSNFEIVDKGGRFILKPQVERYKAIPENEDLTMRLAKAVNIDTPFHGLIYCADGSLSYFIKRFDRISQKDKLPVEDFAQLTGQGRKTKYNSSMEQVANVIKTFCTFPLVQNLKLLKLTLLSFVTGNEDMHLKNFSLITKENQIALTPAYDLLNTSILILNPKEELALPIRGKKNKLTRADILDYYAKDILNLSQPTINRVLEEFRGALPGWKRLIARSFLPQEKKKEYVEMVRNRLGRIHPH